MKLQPPLGFMVRRAGAALTRRILGTLTHVITDQPVVALTFDDGPHPHYTMQIVETLEAYGAKATFFMVGEAARAHPDVLNAVAQAGHAIGNHSWDHPALPLISGRERREQIRACQRVLSPYGQPLFRPPFGRQSVGSRLDVFWLGYQVVAWSVSAGDWIEHRPEVIADALERELSPGSIVLLHDGLYYPVRPENANRAPTVDAVQLLLDRMGRRYRFVTIPELLRFGRPHLENWYRKADPAWLNTLVGQKRAYGLRGAQTK